MPNAHPRCTALPLRCHCTAQDNYPEILGHMFIVNAPAIFSLAWRVVRPMLTERTTSKIDIVSGSGTNELLSLIDADQLPTELGGSCECAGGCM